MEEDYIIDKVAWQTEEPDNADSIETIHRYFRSLITFLQDNALVKKTILSPSKPITDDVEIRSSHLTPMGLDLIKACYDKWLRKVGEGMPPEDVSILDKKLSKLRRG